LKIQGQFKQIGESPTNSRL